MIAPAKPLPITTANPEIDVPDSAVEAVVSLLLGVVDRQDSPKESEVVE